MNFFERNFCLTPLSKDAKGELKVKKQDRSKCEKPGCETLKVAYELNLEVFTHKDCDKVPNLDGKFSARLQMATNQDGHGRGMHRGRYRWLSNNGDLIEGRMRGITNAGTHRDCEKCDRRGHMEGVLGGKIVEGKHKGCRVRASYVINYDPGTQGQDTAVSGAIEGVVVCMCEHD